MPGPGIHMRSVRGPRPGRAFLHAQRKGHRSSSAARKGSQGSCPNEVGAPLVGFKRLEVYVLAPQAFSTSYLVLGLGAQRPWHEKYTKNSAPNTTAPHLTRPKHAPRSHSPAQSQVHRGCEQPLVQLRSAHAVTTGLPMHKMSLSCSTRSNSSHMA